MIAARGNYVTIVDMIIKAERFATLYASSSGDDDVDMKEVLKKVSFKPDSTPDTQFIRSLLYKLSTKVKILLIFMINNIKINNFINYIFNLIFALIFEINQIHSIYAATSGKCWPSSGNSPKFKFEPLKSSGLAKRATRSTLIECCSFGCMAHYWPRLIRLKVFLNFYKFIFY